jgi:hypothetical protein
MFILTLFVSNIVGRRVVNPEFAHTLCSHGGDLASTRVAKLRVHAEGQSTS